MSFFANAVFALSHSIRSRRKPQCALIDLTDLCSI